MPDNRIISSSKYIVTSITSSTTDNRLTKRPYTANPICPIKMQNASESFNDTVHSTISNTSSNRDSTTFSNELENMSRLKSEENARLVQSRFKDNTITHSDKNVIKTEVHNKLSEAMDIEVDTSTLYKKVKLLNSLKRESNN